MELAGDTGARHFVAMIQVPLAMDFAALNFRTCLSIHVSIYIFIFIFMHMHIHAYAYMWTLPMLNPFYSDCV